jgi:hypothetical protein
MFSIMLIVFRFKILVQKYFWGNLQPILVAFLINYFTQGRI